jgi:hypothetical protein
VVCQRWWLKRDPNYAIDSNIIDYCGNKRRCKTDPWDTSVSWWLLTIIIDAQVDTGKYNSVTTNLASRIASGDKGAGSSETLHVLDITLINLMAVDTQAKSVESRHHLSNENTFMANHILLDNFLGWFQEMLPSVRTESYITVTVYGVRYDCWSLQ